MPQATKKNTAQQKLQVGIIMGSDSDLGVMQASAEVLDQLGIRYELTIVSAHRTPKRLYDYAAKAEKRGLRVIIAGAGGSAHLPGMTAAICHLPVIGVPVLTKTMHGLDSLLSIMQMPPGIPVATVAINGAKNAGILAAEIIACGGSAGDKKILAKLGVYKRTMQKQVLGKAAKLERNGFRKYF